MNTPWHAPASGLLLCLLAACKPAGPPAAPPASVAASQPAPSAAACPPVTQVNITAVTVSGSTATATLAPDPAPLNNKGRTAGVRWNLPTGYSFTANGVTFAATPAGPSASSADKPDVYQWCFLADATGPWKYTLEFQDSASPPAVWRCDPTVVNGDGLAVAAPVDVPCTKQP